MTSQRARAFTQVELLAVIAIVGVLAAILIPVINSARQSSQASQCASNLRQLGQGYLLHLANNRGEAPMDNDVGISWPVAVMITVLGETHATKIKQDGDNGRPRPYPPLICPSASVKPNTYYASNYSINVNCLSRLNSANRNGPPTIRPLQLAQAPGRILLAMDAPPHSTLGGIRVIYPELTWGETQFNEMFRHKNRANAVYLDGHVAAIHREDVNERLPKITYGKKLPWRDWDF